MNAEVFSAVVFIFIITRKEEIIEEGLNMERLLLRDLPDQIA
jgi:hypothetical protein